MKHSHHRIAIIGSGFGGLCAAIRLLQEGARDFVLLERAQEVGGVWRDNAYPGCACDVQSHLYSFSFAPNPSWSRSYSRQAEIQAYLQDCAVRFGVLPHCRFGHDVQEARWDEDHQRWALSTSRGLFTADVLVSGAGALSAPSIPRLPGLERFGGKVMHSAQWDHRYALEGKRVAVVGTGASAIQFVPEIQPRVASLTLLQRTPPWILPRRDKAIPGWLRRLYQVVPGLQLLARGGLYVARELLALAFMYPVVLRRAQWLALRHLERSIPDEALRRKLTPDYTMGCKRILLSDDYLVALTRPNVEVVTSSIRELTEDAVVTQDGRAHPVDAVILGTGFRVTDLPIARHIRGREGRTLEETWAGSPRAHLGISVSGFPNFFMLQGPNTGLGHTSVITMIESQVEHLLQALRHLEHRGLAALEPDPRAQAAFVRDLDTRMGRTVWLQGGCSSWYLDATGRNSTLWPGFTFSYRRRLEAFDAAEYLEHGPPPQQRKAANG